MNEPLEPATENYLEADIPEIVEQIDPDWTDHFFTAHDAFYHYKRYSTTTEWLQILAEYRNSYQ